VVAGVCTPANYPARDLPLEGLRGCARARFYAHAFTPGTRSIRWAPSPRFWWFNSLRRGADVLRALGYVIASR